MGGCSSNPPEQNMQEIIKEKAINFALSEGQKYYAEKVRNNELYKSVEDPKVVSIEVMEDKYCDIRCCVNVVYVIAGEAMITDVYYEMRLEYDRTNDSLSIITQRFYGF